MNPSFLSGLQDSHSAKGYCFLPHFSFLQSLDVCFLGLQGKSVHLHQALAHALSLIPLDRKRNTSFRKHYASTTLLSLAAFISGENRLTVWKPRVLFPTGKQKCCFAIYVAACFLGHLEQRSRLSNNSVHYIVLTTIKKSASYLGFWQDLDSVFVSNGICRGFVIHGASLPCMSWSCFFIPAVWFSLQTPDHHLLLGLTDYFGRRDDPGQYKWTLTLEPEPEP